MVRFMAKRYTTSTHDAARVLGVQVATAQRRQRMTAARVAEQANVSLVTLRKVERGDPTVALGTALEIATLVGVPLFGATGRELAELRARGEDRLALLPTRVTPIDDEGLDDDF